MKALKYFIGWVCILALGGVLSFGEGLHSLNVEIPADSAASEEEADSLGEATSVNDTVSWSSSNFTYNIARESFTLLDGAVLKYKGATLKADTIFLDNKNEMVEARGRPTIQEKSQPPIWGYRLKYNHKRQIGEIYWGTTSRDRQMFNGIEVRRQKDGEIHIARGDFSTCDNLEDQHYFFYSRRMVLEPKKKVLARPVVMNIAGVPVAVAPMIVMPLGEGRRSGFLRPKWGGDQAQGFYIQDIGYYWSMNEYMDLTVSGDLIEGAKGTFDETNLNAKYNYNKRNVLNGNLGGRAYVSEFNPGNSGWEVSFNHDHKITPDGKKRLSGNGRFVSSRRILSEALNEEEAINQTANAKLGYTQMLDWNRARLNINGSQDFNLTTGRQTREFPNATFAFSGPLFPLEENDYWDFENPEGNDLSWYEKINYSYTGDFNVYRSENPEAQTKSPADGNNFVGARNRLSLNAKYSMLQYINVNPFASATHYWSLQSNIGKDGSYKSDVDLGEGNFGDNLLNGNLGVEANTQLYGIGNINIGPLQKIRHVVRPSVSYTFVPETDSVRHFVLHPRLGGQLKQQQAQRVGFNLGNDVDIKLKDASDTTGEASKNYQVLKVNSGLSYDFEKKDERPWSDISSNISSEVVKYVPISLAMTHRLYDDYAGADLKNELVSPILINYSFGWRKSLSLAGKFNSGLKLDVSENQDPYEMRPWSANFNYSFSYGAQRVSKTAFRKNLTHSFSSNFKLNPTPHWDLSYTNSYDFSKGEFAQHKFNISRILHCWKMDFEWIPVGVSQGWRFNIYVMDLPDIKFESRDTKLPNRGF